MTDRAPCVRCGRILQTGTNRVLIGFTPDELAQLASDTTDRNVRSRLICALELLATKPSQ